MCQAEITPCERVGVSCRLDENSKGVGSAQLWKRRGQRCPGVDDSERWQEAGGGEGIDGESA